MFWVPQDNASLNTMRNFLSLLLRDTPEGGLVALAVVWVPWLGAHCPSAEGSPPTGSPPPSLTSGCDFSFPSGKGLLNMSAEIYYADIHRIRIN